MSSQQSVTKFVEPIKSATDERLYRHLTLPNKLEVLLVSDPETDKSAAALDVHVGHFSDPEVAPGLAHFCEHMLFLGTKKYPDENSYSAYLNAHGGYSNAFTANEDTNYYFEVNHEHLEGALDRFAQFFLEPLFTASATDREMQAVHNENAKNLQNDVWRHYQLLKSTANPIHPFSKFGTGNLKTLKEDPIAKGVDIRNELLKFHETYYSANIMKLCVVGREPLDTLQKWAVEKFSGVRNTNIPFPVPSVPAFTPEQLANVVHVVPVKDLRSVSYLWPMKETFSVYRFSPASVLSHLIGHEAEGSILALLKEKGWASSLSAGANHNSLNFAVFSVSIDLTPEGLAHVSDITQIMYQYIALLNQASDQRYHEIWAEERDVHAMNFRFKSKENVSDYASHLVGNMQTYTPEDTLCGGSLFHEFSEKHIREYLSFLRPDNMRVHVISQSFKGQTKKEEPWYGTNYDIRPLSQQELQAYKSPGSNSGLFLPKKNEFIASDFTLKADGKTFTEEEKNGAPVLLLNNSQARVWFKLDKKFLKPKANVWMIIASPEAYSSPTAAVLTDLYCKLLEDSLNEYAYDAEIAGLAYSLTPTVTGLKLSFSGYNHKLAVLLGKVVERMRTLAIKPERFARIKEKVTRALKNWELEAPYSHAMYHASNAVEIGRWHHREKLEVMDACTPEALSAHIKALLSKMHMELLAHGNLTDTECMDVVKMIVSTTPINGIPQSQIPEERIANLPYGYTYLIHERARNPSDVNSAIQITYQIGEDTVRTHALLEVMAHLAVEKAYHQLRTIEQLGYLVWSGLAESRGVLSYRVIVQSSNRSPSYLDERVESFVHQFREMLVKMPEEEYQESVAGAVAKKLEKDQKLRDETEKHWAEIGRHRYMFGRVNLEANEMKSVKKSEIIEFYDQFIKCGAAQRRKMSSQIVGNIHDIEADRKTFLGPRTVTINHIAGPGVAAPSFDFKPVHDISHIAAAQPVVVHPVPAVVAGTSGPAASPPLEPKPEAEAPPVQDDADEAEAAEEDGKVAEECERPSPAPEQIVLLPAPVDTTPVVHITDFPKFRRSVPLYPVLV